MNTSFDKKLLYFLPSAVPSAMDKETARNLMFRLEASVKFRNGAVDAGGGNPEKCDYVFGVDIKGENGDVIRSSIPADYFGRFTVVDVDGAIVSEPFAVKPASAEATPPNSLATDKVAAEIGTANKGGWGPSS